MVQTVQSHQRHFWWSERMSSMCLITVKNLKLRQFSTFVQSKYVFSDATYKCERTQRKWNKHEQRSKYKDLVDRYDRKTWEYATTVNNRLSTSTLNRNITVFTWLHRKTNISLFMKINKSSTKFILWQSILMDISWGVNRLVYKTWE